MPDMLMLETEEKMEKSLNSYRRELATIRTGRANPSLLDSINVDYYGVSTPLKQVAGISVPEANQILIKPFDKSILKDIESAINASSLGLTPQGDGTSIRLNSPQMTEQRRKELVKLVSKMSEQAKVNIRNIRRDANDDLKKLSLSEDDEKGYLDDIQTLTNNKIVIVETYTKEKEEELLTI
ncbi:MAG: ribosome recycling factor [Anaeroplasmataceae bacterium]